MWAYEILIRIIWQTFLHFEKGFPPTCVSVENQTLRIMVMTLE